MPNRTGNSEDDLNPQRIAAAVLPLRGQRVMLDRDLARMHGVETRALKQAVRRNRVRFPGDFMFQLTSDEVDGLVSQNVIPGKGALGGS
jgi:hypothetical protein